MSAEAIDSEGIIHLAQKALAEKAMTKFLFALIRKPEK